MIYALLADLLLLLHVAFVLFVLGGGVLARWWPRISWIHLPAATWGALVAFLGLPSPLTPLENQLREMAGRATRETGVVERIVDPVVPGAYLPWMQMLVGVAIVLINVAIYWVVVRRREAF